MRVDLRVGIDSTGDAVCACLDHGTIVGIDSIGDAVCACLDLGTSVGEEKGTNRNRSGGGAGPAGVRTASAKDFDAVGLRTGPAGGELDVVASGIVSGVAVRRNSSTVEGMVSLKISTGSQVGLGRPNHFTKICTPVLVDRVSFKSSTKRRSSVVPRGGGGFHLVSSGSLRYALSLETWNSG